MLKVFHINDRTTYKHISVIRDLKLLIQLPMIDENIWDNNGSKEWWQPGICAIPSRHSHAYGIVHSLLLLFGQKLLNDKTTVNGSCSVLMWDTMLYYVSTFLRCINVFYANT